jgi:hypothetical protein
MSTSLLAFPSRSVSSELTGSVRCFVSAVATGPTSHRPVMDAWPSTWESSEHAIKEYQTQ